MGTKPDGGPSYHCLSGSSTPHLWLRKRYINTNATHCFAFHIGGSMAKYTMTNLIQHKYAFSISFPHDIAIGDF